jgi:2-(1,2-epoxy-1,2-dihydrophenyl)acetyl-CoA isomerase
MELALLGDKFDAVTAERYGLVNDVFPADTFDDEVNRIAERLVQGPPLAHAQIKRLFNVSAVNSLDNQLTEEVDSFAEMSSSEDFVEGVSAFLEKRKPSFNGR